MQLYSSVFVMNAIGFLNKSPTFFKQFEEDNLEFEKTWEEKILRWSFVHMICCEKIDGP